MPDMKDAGKELPAAYEKVIHLKNLKKTFENNFAPVVDGISFSVDSGSLACMIGTSGCGKTTTLKIINRLIEPTSGTIEVNGIKSHEMSAVEWRRKIGYVIQKIGLLPHLTVKENISLLSSVLKKKKKIIRERTDYLLQLVELDPKKIPGSLPFGIKWRTTTTGGNCQSLNGRSPYSSYG